MKDPETMRPTARIPVPPPPRPNSPFEGDGPDAAQKLRTDAGKRSWLTWKKAAIIAVAAVVIGAAVYVAQRQLAKSAASNQAKTPAAAAVPQAAAVPEPDAVTAFAKAEAAEKKADAISDWFNDPNAGFIKKLNETHDLQEKQKLKIEALEKEIGTLKGEIAALKKRGEASESEEEAEGEPFLGGE